MLVGYRKEFQSVKHRQSYITFTTQLISHCIDEFEMKFFSHENYNRIAYQILSSFFLFISYLYEVFSEGEEGISWYIILKGSVNVVVHGKVRHIRLPCSQLRF